MPNKDSWNSRIGVILAVSGSAVGLGNFLRFPGQVAQYGGGAFMLAYFISFLLIGLPICWAEWTMGRMGGQRGFHSSPGIFNLIIRRPWGKYLGILGVTIPLIIYMYYVYIESWCLGYSLGFVRGVMEFDTVAESGAFWSNFIGAGEDGSAVGFGIDHVGMFLVICFALNFILIYRGIAKGIELFCLYAMPALVVLALVILVRVLTLGTPDAAKPNQNILNGLGYLWNPTKVILQERTEDESGMETWSDLKELVGTEVVETGMGEAAASPNLRIVEKKIFQQLKNPQLWLAAAGQIFFSLSVGFGVIINYASYLKKTDDIVLSGLSATSANEFCEVSLGGLISIPAAYAFLGIAGVAGMGTFGLGFNVLPMVFSNMPFGNLFGFLFFFLLFLAAVTSSLSMLQPVVAFLEEALKINRKQSVVILGLFTALGSSFVVYFSKNVKALDTLDFWMGTFMIFVLATTQIIMFGWVVGMEKGWKEIHLGASIRVPRLFQFIMKFVTPLFLLVIFFFFIGYNVLGVGQSGVSNYVVDLIGDEGTPPNLVARLSVGLILLALIFIGFVTATAAKSWTRQLNREEGTE
ncbi:MAG: sodium:calcium symporter [Opitutae bacterium]|nr:sodium:calcium symporter [Opitutae bacterium]